MRYTVFSCGIFYERFAPGGLSAINIGSGYGAHQQGAHMLNIAEGLAEIPLTNAQGRAVYVTMTSVYDVALFVAAVIELGIETWPTEFKMRGAHVTTQRLVDITQEETGGKLSLLATCQHPLTTAIISTFKCHFQALSRTTRLAKLLRKHKGRDQLAQDATPDPDREWSFHDR